MSDNDDYITVDSLEQAEKIILEHINNGENYRDISQITFSINDNIKRFNPSQISKIKGKNEENQAQSSHDPDKALVFKMFNKGKTPTDVVIETKLDFEYVKKAHEQYRNFEGKITIPESFYDKVIEAIQEVDATYDCFPYFNYGLDELVKSYRELKKHVYCCSRCGVDIPIRNKSLEDAQEHLSSEWHHSECP